MPPETETPSKSLVIQPIFYKGRRLKEVGDRLVAALYPRLENCEIRDEITELPCGIELSRKYKSVSREVDGMLLFLAGIAKPPVLGIIPLHIIKPDGSKAAGYSGALLGSAFVTTYRPEFTQCGSDEHADLVYFVGLHEIGHLAWLDHHSRNGYCPMGFEGIEGMKKGLDVDYTLARNARMFKKCCDEIGIPYKK